MKPVAWLLILLAGAAQAGGYAGVGITNANALEAAIVTAVTAGRPSVLEFAADWCPGCRILAQTLHEPALRAGLGCAKLIVVNLSAGEGNHAAAQITQQYRLGGLPTLVFLNADGVEQEALRLTGPVPATRVRTSLAGVC